MRRHIDRGVGQRHRPARAGEAVDKHAVQERAAQGRQKRRPGGNCEDLRRAMGHARLLCGARGKASRRLEERFGSPSQRRGEPFPCVLVARNPESQPVGVSAKGRVRIPAVSSRSKAARASARAASRKSDCAADDSPAGALQESVEPRCVLAKAHAHCFEPIRIGERPNSDRNRRPADGPRAKGGPQGWDDVWRRERETEPQPGQSVGLAERAQDDRAARGQRWREAFALGVEIGEGFVDDQHTSASCEARMKIEERGARSDPTVRVVGIDHDRDVEAVQVLEPVHLDDASAGRGEGGCKTAIGRPQRADRPMRQNARERLDERLRAGTRDDAFRRRRRNGERPRPRVRASAPLSGKRDHASGPRSGRG